MPIGFLVAVALAAIVTAAALAPAPRSWTLGQLIWRLGLQANELPLLVAIWIVIATALAGAQGNLSTAAGIFGAGVGALTLAGLAVVVWRGLRAGPAAARALEQGLNLDSRAGLARQLGRRPWLRLVFAPLAVRRHDVLRQADTAYGTAGRFNTLDVYRPRSGAMTGPCLVYFHGGGYRSGRKNREARALIYRLASQGWLCVSANYRLARAAPYPAPLVDAKRVIAWVREHAPEYGADPSAIVVAGSSAGAHLAATAALTPNAAPLQPGFEQADTHVCAAICLYGFYGSPRWIEREPGAPSAPVELLGPSAPPMFIAHGTHDSFVPVAIARDFAKRCRIAAPQRSMVYLELPGAKHTFDLYYSPRFHAVIGAVLAFVDSVVPSDSHER